MRDAASHSDPVISLAGLRRFRVWVTFLIAFFGGTGVLLGWRLAAERAAQDRDWRDVMSSEACDPGLTKADHDVATDRARRVTVGLYVERISEVSIRDSRFRAQLDIWFNWRGDTYDPAAQLLIVDGVIQSSSLLEQTDEGDRHYRRYKLDVEIAKTFHIHHFPLDRHLLLIAFEDGSSPRDKLLFEIDRQDSAVSSRAVVHGYRLGPLVSLEKPHSYKTSRGRWAESSGTRSTFSQARFGMVIARDSWGPFVKMFQALFVAVVIALLPCFLRPTDLDPRFGLGVGALFAAVANSYLIGALVPDTGEFSLADQVNLLGIVTILITLVESTVSLYLYDHRLERELSRSLDRTSFVVVSVGFAMAVAMMLLGASGGW
ncbi:MAG: hypothetical protein EBS56_05215 [Planctomycetia bacterium]|nr:hypothetical protein [Planctomycetia bacterium]